ncbi:MAG TPA: riboflavin synthase [Pilimelia sp.]|nr:riboflavin synthase [Pilimelia sp.]
MFTGIVEERGSVAAVTPLADAARLSVRGAAVTADARHGDSIAVNGVCLTVVDVVGDVFTADVMAETLRRSTLGRLAPGDPVNLERAATPTTRLGGHLVQGHVDAVATVTGRDASDHWTEVTFAVPGGLGRYLVEKGSVTVDGVSLTVAAVAAEAFTVACIPTTLALTTLGLRGVGDAVNVEVDVVAKYVEKLLGERA